MQHANDVSSYTRGDRASRYGRVLLVMAIVAGGPSAANAGTAIVPSSAAASTSSPTIFVGTATGAVVPINASTRNVGAAIKVSSYTLGVAITPDGSTAYAANYFDNSVGTIDASARVSGSILPGGNGPWGIAVTPDGKTAYVTDDAPGSNTVTPIDVETNTPGPQIKVGLRPAGIAITPDGKTAYVACSSNNTVVPIALATSTTGTPIKVGHEPTGIAITPDGKIVYVANNFGNSVTPITTATKKAGKAIPVGNKPAYVAITPDGKTAYVTNSHGNTVTPITIATNRPGKAIAVGKRPFGIAITPDGKTVYVANLDSNSVSTIATATNKPGAPIAVAGGPQDGVAISPDQAPVAALSVVPAAVGSGVATEFDASGSAGPTSPIVSYRWDFGDGQTAATKGPTTSHVYSAVNTYTATVTETDQVGTSTEQVFTGQTMSRNGGSSAVATARVVIVSCTTNQTCDAKVSAAASRSTPAQTIEATGIPTDPVGTLQVSVAPAALVCKNVDATVAPVVEMTDTGFASTNALTVITTLQNTIRPSSHQVCYNSTIPYLSQSNPTIATAGTALLLDCAAVASTPPCVVSKSQVGGDVVVTTLVPGGDPRLRVVAPTVAKINFPMVPTGKVNKAYFARLQTRGGISPIVWKVLSGRLPKGLTYNTTTGAISGKPRAKGRSTFVVQASDAENPAETAKMTISITIK